MKKIPLVILFVILISNFIPTLEIEVYYFQTAKKEFNHLLVPAKGGSIQAMENSFKRYKKEHPEHENLMLCGTFKKQYWKFWKWRDYLFNPVWGYPNCTNET